jgi:hypothetical protein
MEKAPITSHKSHVSCRGRRQPARSTHAVCGWQAMASAGRGDETWRAYGEGHGGNDAAADRVTRGQPAEAALARVHSAIRQGPVAACMVNTSARHQTGASPVRRTMGTEFRFRYGEGGELPARRGLPAPGQGAARRGVSHTAPGTRKQSRGIFCYRQDTVLRGCASRSVITPREPPRPVGPAIDYSE